MRIGRSAIAVAIAVSGLGAATRADEGARVDVTHVAAQAFLPTRLLPPGARSGPSHAQRVAPPDAADAPLEWIERFDATAPGGAVEVAYTVDPALDDAIRALLARREVALGHVILLDPQTGEVFAYVSTDPERFPATRPYPTASLMKLVTAAAVLRNAPSAARRPCRYVGSPYRLAVQDLEPPPTGGIVLPFRRALAFSNNQCFARLAVHDVGETALLAEIRDIGLLEPPAAEHAAGHVEPVDDALALGLLGSGLDGSFVTPLGAARLAALLAEGRKVEPWWIAGMRDAGGRPLALPQHRSAAAVWDPAVANALRHLLVDVIERGTARRAFHTEAGRPLLGDVAVAGKTGSLSGRDPEGFYQWFIGVAPAEQPRVAIATLVVNGPTGGTSAAQVAALTLQQVFCVEHGCSAALGERLHARSQERELRRQQEIAAHARALIAAQERVEAERALDEPPRPIGRPPLVLPRPLRDRPAHGEIVLLLDLSAEGEVLDVAVDSSDLPHFDAWLAREVRSWRFTAPTRRGRPVEARARLPIPIHVD